MTELDRRRSDEPAKHRSCRALAANEVEAYGNVDTDGTNQSAPAGRFVSHFEPGGEANHVRRRRPYLLAGRRLRRHSLHSTRAGQTYNGFQTRPLGHYGVSLAGRFLW